MEGGLETIHVVTISGVQTIQLQIPRPTILQISMNPTKI